MSGITVPTMDDFTALAARVSALEEGAPVPVPPDPPDPPEPITEGVQAKRIAKLIESFGVNTFSSMDGGNLWGSWPANYQPDSVIDALQFMLGDSGFAFRLREYHYSGREGMQRPWLSQIVNALPGTEVALCVAANGGVDDVPTMLSLADDPACGVKWVEGINEANTDFGSGTIPVETTKAIQDAVWSGARDRQIVFGPSIVAGTPHPEGWIVPTKGYFKTQADMDRINGTMDWGNGHYYPPHAPCVPNTGYSVGEYIGGLWTAYAHHPIGLTEFHPTLYAAGTLAIKRNIARLAGRLHRREEPIPAFKSTEPRDAFYTLTTLLYTAKCGATGVWWYALFDYGSTYECGLFPKEHASNPRQTAVALQSLCAICADHGDDRRTFEPGKLDVEVSGLTPATDWDCYQASNGRFLLPLWHAAEDAGQGAAVQVVLRFATVKRITVFEPLVGVAAVATSDDVREITVNLPPGVVVLEVITQ